MSPVLSIVVPCFRDAENLRLTLRSLEEQTAVHDERVEVVVTDGGSDDHSSSVWHAYDHLIDRVRSSPDGGVYDGMNLGVETARGRFVQFLNAGDRFRGPDDLATVLSWLEGLGEAERWGVCGATNRGDGLHRPGPIRNVPHRFWPHAYGMQPHCHQATFFHREEFLGLGGHDLDAGLAADHDLIVAFGRISPPAQEPRLLIDYQGGGMSETRVGELPRLLHANRVKRLALGPVLSRIDGVLGRLVWATNRARVRMGRMRRALRQR